jgi:hypothetical protein
MEAGSNYKLVFYNGQVNGRKKNLRWSTIVKKAEARETLTGKVTRDGYF